MHIAGGLYRELCCVPPWNAMFGSGGRAAAAVSALSKGSTLHAYSQNAASEDVASLEMLGVNVCLNPRPTDIAFAYFHPLSRPNIQPHPNEIKLQPPLQVNGEAVLRFGFLEGDAIVDAHRAVYDPQSSLTPIPFHKNGSVAKELAIVLNELELRSATGIDNLILAASYLMEHQGASIVVAKRGVRGAMVFERGYKAAHIPAYRSSRVFKIGTGDVFSAIFAYYWAEKGLSAKKSADEASRSVAAYCSSIQLPIENDVLRNQVPLKSSAFGVVALKGSVATIGQRYTMEEARFVLHELGVEVTCQVLDASSQNSAAAMLILSDGFGDEAVKLMQQAKAGKTPVVLLRESGSQEVDTSIRDAGITVTDDFVTAVYFAAWAAAEHA